jgi:CheY-like chemotaxis protein
MPNPASYILLADDDVDDQELLVDRFLLSNPYAIFKLCKNGEEALQYLLGCTGELPTILMLDYKMPLMTGAEVLRYIQGYDRFKAIRKFVWSTSDHVQYANECIQHGAERYFTKPNSVAELDQVVTYLSTVLETTF